MADFDINAVLQQAATAQQAQQVQDKADSAVLSAKAKDVASAQDVTYQQQTEAIAQQAITSDDLTKRIADGVQTVNNTYGGNSADATSDMAKNNVALHDINQRILQQYGAITNLQNDTSVMGGLGQMFALPGMLKGMDILHGMHTEISDANDRTLQAINNETTELKSNLTNTDVAGNLAKSAVLTANALAIANQNRQLSIGEQLTQMKTVSDLAKTDTAMTADALTKQITTPLEIARNKLSMAKDEAEIKLTTARLDDYTADQTAMAKLAGDLGMDKIKFKTFAKSIPANDLYALMGWSFSGGKLQNPNDKDIIQRYMNPTGLIDADGKSSQSLAGIQEMNRLQPQIDSVTSAYKAWVAKTYANDPKMIDELLNQKVPDATQKAAFMSDMNKTGFKINSDFINANPNKVLELLTPAVTAQIPLVVEQAKNMGNTSLNMPFGKLVESIAKANMDANPADIAKQLYTYGTNAFSKDQERPVWGMVGLPKPNAAISKVVAPNFFNSEQEGEVDATNYASIFKAITGMQQLAKLKAAAASPASQRINAVLADYGGVR